jgi:predicted dehydrogenase
MTARPPVRIGIVGARLAADTHVRALAHLRGTRAEVTAVAAATRQSAEAFARRHEVPVALDDWRALVERPDVDLVAVCCPNDLHEEVTVAAYSRRWRTSGGGSLLRMGSHPVATLLHLKHAEGRLRHGRPIRARSVFAEVGELTRLPQVTAAPKAYFQTGWVDVEDWGCALITFEDGTRGTVIASDISLGGMRNLISAFMSTGAAHITINGYLSAATGRRVELPGRGES